MGFWFSLGHSLIVLRAVVPALDGREGAGRAGGGRRVGAALDHRDRRRVGVRGRLWILGILNLAVLWGIIGVFPCRMRTGSFDEQELEHHLNDRGLMNRFLGGLTNSVTKPWHIYPVGLLFGLGFDTATRDRPARVGGRRGRFQPAVHAILVLPVLFAAGMCLLDTIDGVFMNFAYDWAFAKPVRKIFYNIIITALSVAVALIIGTIELLSVLADQAGIKTGPLAAIASIPLDYAGYGIVALFVVAWLVALAVWRFGRIEERWGASLAPAAD